MTSSSLHSISVLGDSPKRRRLVDGNQWTQASSVLQMWRRIEQGSDVEQRIKAKKTQNDVFIDDISIHTSDTVGNIKHCRLSEGHSEMKADANDEQQSCPTTVETGRERIEKDPRDRMNCGGQGHSSKPPQLCGSSKGQCLSGNEYGRVKTVRECVKLTARERGYCPYKKVGTKINARNEVSDGFIFNQTEGRPSQILRKTHMLGGKQAFHDFLQKAEKERQCELQELTLHCAVSQFSYRNRIQYLLRSRLLRNTNLSKEKQKKRNTAAMELELLTKRQTVSDLRDGFLYPVDNFGPIQLDTMNCHSPSSSGMKVSGNKGEITEKIPEKNILAKEDRDTLNLRSLHNVNLEETMHASDESLTVVNEKGIQIEVNRENAASADLTESISGMVGKETFQENVDDMSNDHLMGTVDGQSLGTSQNDYGETIVSNGNKTWNASENEGYAQVCLRGLTTEVLDALPVSNSLNASGNNMRTSELSELVGRRRVSYLLGSGFRENLNRLLLTIVERQTYASIGWDISDYMSTSVSKVTRQELQLKSQNEHTTNTLDPTHLSGGPPQIIHEPFLDPPGGHPLKIKDWKVISDMRMDITSLKLRMDEMQRMLEACMNTQLQLQCSIKHEVAVALSCSLSPESVDCDLPTDKSKWDLVRKGICCVCSHNNIDTLLYRCGHMCACTNCANRLFEEKKKCPICQSLIVKVLSAFRNTNKLTTPTSNH